MNIQQKISLKIPIRPTPKGRPRTAVRGGRAIIYTPETTAKFEKAVAQYARLKVKNMLSGPLTAILEFHFIPPKSWSEKKKAQAFDHVIKPDLDNLEKSVLDALEGICFENDSQICRKSSSKRYGSTDQIIVTILSEGADEFVTTS